MATDSSEILDLTTLFANSARIELYFQRNNLSEVRPMETVVVTGSVNDQHVLSANVPNAFPPGPVTIVVLPNRPDDDSEREWVNGIAREWADVLNDPRQDIYTLNDGEPVDAT